MSRSLLEVEALSTAQGLARVSLALSAGEIVALLGANGAGKSTLLKALMGLVPATGTIRFAGEAITHLPPQARARRGLGYLPEGRRVFPGMSLRDNLLVACSEKAGERARRLDAVLALFPALGRRAGMPAWQLSGGQQQMLALGRALMAKPKLLLLDEPSLGLAPVVAEELADHIRALAAQGAAVLLAEQNVARALAIAPRAYALSLGRIVAQGRSDTLRASGALERVFLGAEIGVSSGKA